MSSLENMKKEVLEAMKTKNRIKGVTTRGLVKYLVAYRGYHKDSSLAKNVRKVLNKVARKGEVQRVGLRYKLKKKSLTDDSGKSKSKDQRRSHKPQVNQAKRRGKKREPKGGSRRRAARKSRPTPTTSESESTNNERDPETSSQSSNQTSSETD